MFDFKEYIKALKEHKPDEITPEAITTLKTSSTSISTTRSILTLSRSRSICFISAAIRC